MSVLSRVLTFVGVLACTFASPIVASASGHDHAGPAPIPATAEGSNPDPAKGYVVEETRGGLYWIGNGAYMVMAMVGPNGVALIDAPPSLHRQIMPALAEITDQPLTHLVYSHLHGDHIGGAGYIAERNEGLTIIAHERTAELLARGLECTDCVPGSNPRPAPTITFDDTYTLNLGAGQVLELRYRGPNHADGNIFIHAPRHRTLMLVDVAYPGWVPFDLLSVSTDIPGWITAYDRILEYDFDTFVGGHIARTGTRADIETGRDYVQAVRAAAIAALRDNPRSKVIPPLAKEHGGANRWWLTDQHTIAVVDQCAQAVSNDWQGRLGGVETYAREHCKRMQFSLRID
ncbi:MBL fold metallo-hydrolase [Erythrobacter rubeus]|uniref:MBL fold metallo-hydrolase n=1 Tax=Erythrobacter rubeus TaxID=2760803 RepID=A0ABR8KRP5_9SPHN|nr:MBL fold metallo-hydrolase [Erythrobacter rubeus]MBD2841903.1 MBL fold metallo-hydrolase [Erythrobacter rubeus]